MVLGMVDSVLESVSSMVEASYDLTSAAETALLAFFIHPQSPLLDAQRNATLAGEWGNEPLAECMVNASFFLAAAVDHAQAAVRLLSGPAESWPVWALDPLLRASVEASARAWHLFDPARSDVGRVACYMNELIYSATEHGNLSTLYPLASGPGRTMDEIYAGAKTLGVPRYKKSKWLLEPRLSSTELFNLLLDGPRFEWTFRALSAGAHPVVWSVVGRAPVAIEKWQRREPTWLRAVALLAPLDDTITILALAFGRWASLVSQNSGGWSRALDAWLATTESVRSAVQPTPSDS